MFGAVWLDRFAFLYKAIVPETLKYVLNDLSVLFCRSSTEDCEVDSEPIVDSFVDGMIFGAKFFRRDTFRERFGFGGGTIL